MKSNLKMIFAFAGGLLAGAALGVLFAPDKGENTRKRITSDVDSYFKKLKKS